MGQSLLVGQCLEREAPFGFCLINQMATWNHAGAWPLSVWQPVSKAGLSLTLWVVYKSPTSQQAMTFLGNISLY